MHSRSMADSPFVEEEGGNLCEEVFSTGRRFGPAPKFEWNVVRVRSQEFCRLDGPAAPSRGEDLNRAFERAVNKDVRCRFV